MLLEFLIPKRPVSLQSKNSKNRENWKEFVRTEAKKTYSGILHDDKKLHLSLFYLYEDSPLDVDNIIKPIQDALIGVVYRDDSVITDVESHRRHLKQLFDITQCPTLLMQGILSEKECVYVKIDESKSLEKYL